MNPIRKSTARLLVCTLAVNIRLPIRRHSANWGGGAAGRHWLHVHSDPLGLKAAPIKQAPAPALSRHCRLERSRAVPGPPATALARAGFRAHRRRAASRCASEAAGPYATHRRPTAPRARSSHRSAAACGRGWPRPRVVRALSPIPVVAHASTSSPSLFTSRSYPR